MKNVLNSLPIKIFSLHIPNSDISIHYDNYKKSSRRVWGFRVSFSDQYIMKIVMF